MLEALGKNPSGKLLEKINQSPQYKAGIFVNTEPTVMIPKGTSYVGMMREFFNKPQDVIPHTYIPTVKTNLYQLTDTSTPHIVWFGHSSYLIAYKEERILVDPVFTNASPVSFFGKPFLGTNIYQADDMPDIDILVITHDHYDHLDYKTLIQLKSKIKKIVCSLGVSAHLVYWGFEPSIIFELDWQQKVSFGSAHITALPARHFSGRTISRNKTLWNSYVLEFDTYKIFLGGDSGYDGQFKITGDTYGPFDLAFVECGQYGKNWPFIHMTPEETAKASLELKAKVVLPVHWGKFALALHPWNDSIKRLLIAAKDMSYKIVSPKIGEVYPLEKEFVQETWWNI